MHCTFYWFVCMHTRAFSSFSSLFFFMFTSLHAPGHFILAVWALPPHPPKDITPWNPISHFQRGWNRWGGGKWRGTQHLTAHSIPAFTLVFLGCWLGVWFFSPSPPVVKLCHFSVFQMIHWERGKQSIKRTSLAFLSRIKGFSTKDSGHFWSSKMHS